VYSRVSTAATELGVSQREAFQFTELVGQADAVAGQSSAAAAGALTQLAQAMGGTVVQAQEFNSILDGARPLIVAAARGMDEAGGSVAKFRQLVLAGQVTAEEFFRPVMRGSAAITEPFEQAVIRPSQALQNLRTAIIETIGEMDTASGATGDLAGQINALAAAISSDAFQEGAAEFAADLGGGLGDAVTLAQELNAWVGRLTSGFADLGDVISFPAQQFKFIVDQNRPAGRRDAGAGHQPGGDRDA
jgi:tape measure domain-containing protein